MDCKNCKHVLVLGCGHCACRHPAMDNIYDDPMQVIAALLGDGFSAIPAKRVNGEEIIMVHVDVGNIENGKVKFPFHYDHELINRCLFREEELQAAARKTEWVVKE